MSITQPKVFIITVTFNSCDFIISYLDALAPYLQQGNYQLILVDNASVDNTCKIIEKYLTAHSLQSKISLIQLKENLGFGKGCNKGAQAAQEYNPDFLWFLNPDTKVFKNSGESLLKLFQENNNIDFTGSILVDDHMTPRAGAFRFPGLINTFLSSMKLGILDRLLHRYSTAEPITKTPIPVDWLTGASFMAKASSFYTLKGFDPEYFLYYEEVDFFHRAKRAGFNAWTCPDSKIFHMAGASTGIDVNSKATKRRPQYWFESRRTYYIKNHGHLYFVLIDWIFLCGHFLWKIRAKLQNKKDLNPPFFIKDIIKNGYPALLFSKERK